MARRSTRRLLTLLPALALAATAAGCAEKVNTGGDTEAGGEINLMKPGKLVTCTHLPYPPFQFKQDGKTVGFDVDIVDLVAEDLGVEQEIFDTSFEGIESGASFETGQCDLAAAAITINEERKKVMDFSNGYFDANQALLVRTGSGITGLHDLGGKTLGVQLGTTGEDYATEHKDEHGYEIRQFEDLALMQTAVKTGQVDAAINDNSVLYDFVKQNPDTEVTEEFETGEEYGIAVRKGNGALLAKINEVLAKAKSDGTYDQIYEKWFGKKPESK
ncbi:polar amino acid transport system substrate-binding protein [Amycolatopsis arida]|uniref:Polar amino acid transport system substrate-binding protein n=1 Tax=Amycolatopsis arida TaxID=587909 RepID=A0A1I5TGW1_9PSEU|nr:basic amino acid ABC transporter substrate-binding protein [Amycolatopsis arida]TDX96097.1 polar amino acid transport system substrate-binding protein [Amycolatopsis arida]SFP82289.1 polar amino acid transport system substrate-binding protein [Amycolatopsis arida]